MSSSSPQTPKDDEKIVKLLQEAGLEENTPIDPSSRLALQELLLNKTDANDNGLPDAPLVQISTDNKVLQRHVSELSGPPAAAFETTQSNMSTAGSENDSLLSKEDRIMKHLERQTAMLVDLHQRVEELTKAVQHQQQRGDEKPRRTETLRVSRTLTIPHAQNNPVEQQTAPAEQQQQQQPAERHVAAAAAPNNNNNRMVYTARIRRLIQLFVRLRRRQAPNFHGGLILKVLIMMSILFTRISYRRRHSDEQDWVWDYRYYLMIFLVLGGFFVQTGFAKFLYIFFVKENYPARILWQQEDVDDAAAAMQQPEVRHPRLHRPRNQPDPNRPAEGWRHTFVGGGIARRNDNDNEAHRGGGLWQWIQDLGFLFGSFFLSIFPMWRPEALGRHPEEEGVQEENNDNGLPQVQPPRDVVQAEEEEEEQQQPEE